MSGNPDKASIWGDADVYIAPLGTAFPDSIDEPFSEDWKLVGLLDGEAGFEEERSRDSNDFFAWGGILVRTARRNFVLTRKFTALEENAVTTGLVWPGSGPGERAVPVANHRFLIAFETTDGPKKRRVISSRHAEVEEVGTIKDSESELTKYEITVKIYPNGAKRLFDVQPPLEEVGAVALVAIATTPATKTVKVGEYAPITVTATYSDNSTRDVTALAGYATSAANKATVDRGYVKGVAVGTSNVTASFAGQNAICAVTVEAA